MAKGQTAAVVAEDNPPPTIYLRDEQIEKYAGESFDKLEIDDVLDIPFKVKVVGLNKRKEMEYKDGKEKGPKTHRSIDLELVAKEGKKEKSNVEKALDTIGRKAKY